MQMSPDQLEYAISQYLDGTLARLESAALEERLASDADARELFGEYQRLDGVVSGGVDNSAQDTDAAPYWPPAAHGPRTGRLILKHEPARPRAVLPASDPRRTHATRHAPIVPHPDHPRAPVHAERDGPRAA